ncbi:uncharacterized protein LOC126655268 isoform X2 [Mercurialis annua]|uniref:uncharacterized protein LOC126655268 isoform X2 n=1 Tax=Mercurialis annua TaxID=3986 RepID=UPI00215E4C2E|nr:uncharacterized protein LOC126655268 isoform X2 [Mercurialis annua]
MVNLRQLTKELYLFKTSNSSSSSSLLNFLSSAVNGCPWSFTQSRGARVTAIHLRPGNVIETKGKVYQVVDVEHKQRGRGGASMQVELRNIDNGNKQSLRFNTEEAIERVFVEERSFTFLYEEQGKVFLMDPEKFEQLEVPAELFGKAAPYLKDEMRVKLQLYDEKPLSGSIPKQVTCTIKETQAPMKGLTATPRYKKALLDNNLTIQVPAYLDVGEAIIVDTNEDSYITRANK